MTYNGLEAGQPPHFCRLPRGATTCDVALTLPTPPTTESLSRPIVTVAGARVVVLQQEAPQSAPLIGTPIAGAPPAAVGSAAI